MDGLTPGRIVHYAGSQVHYAGRGEVRRHVCLAAIVTAVLDESRASLHVFDADGNGGFGTNASYSEQPTLGTWHWPERA